MSSDQTTLRGQILHRLLGVGSIDGVGGTSTDLRIVDDRTRGDERILEQGTRCGFVQSVIVSSPHRPSAGVPAADRASTSR